MQSVRSVRVHAGMEAWKDMCVSLCVSCVCVSLCVCVCVCVLSVMLFVDDQEQRERRREKSVQIDKESEVGGDSSDDREDYTWTVVFQV